MHSSDTPRPQRHATSRTGEGSRRLLGLSVLSLVVVMAAMSILDVTRHERLRVSPRPRIVPTFEMLGRNQVWAGLTLHGHIPIPGGQYGRSDPFRPGTVSPDTPESRDAIRVRDILSLSTALGWYFTDTGHYPVARDLLLGEDQARCLTSNSWLSSGGCASADRRYLDPVPHDPGHSQYRYTSNGSFYTINVALEAASGTLSSWEYRVSNRERK